MNSSTTISICLDHSSDDEFCWYLKVNGEQIGFVLEVVGSDVSDEILIDACRAEYLSSNLDGATIEVCR